jgi:hypothetical protein
MRAFLLSVFRLVGFGVEKQTGWNVVKEKRMKRKDFYFTFYLIYFCEPRGEDVHIAVKEAVIVF